MIIQALLLALLHISVVENGLSGPPGCPANDWIAYGDYCYFFEIFPQTQSIAKLDCKSKNSSLVTLETTEEMEYLTKFMYRPQMTYAETIWIGLEKNSQSGKYEWIDGSDLNIVSYSSNFSSQEKCVAMNANKWQDFDCDISYVYICKKLNELVPTALSTTTTPETISTTLSTILTTIILSTTSIITTLPTTSIITTLPTTPTTVTLPTTSIINTLSTTLTTTPLPTNSTTTTLSSTSTTTPLQTNSTTTTLSSTSTTTPLPTNSTTTTLSSTLTTTPLPTNSTTTTLSTTSTTSRLSTTSVTTFIVTTNQYTTTGNINDQKYKGITILSIVAVAIVCILCLTAFGLHLVNKNERIKYYVPFKYLLKSKAQNDVAFSSTNEAIQIDSFSNQNYDE